MSQSTYQFTADDADIILRTSESPEPRQFRVHKSILSTASPVFKDMFAIPQPESSTTPSSVLQIIDVSDTPEDLDTFLRLIYPTDFPPMQSLDAIIRGFVILDKYEVQGGPLQYLKLLLVSPVFLKCHPISVYSIACGWKFKKEADIAAPHTTSLDVLSSTSDEDIQRMTGTEYHRILTLGKQRQSRCQDNITHTLPTCSGCPNYRNFYPNFRCGLLAGFKADRHIFYDYGTCIIRCFEIAVETDRMVQLGCGIAQGSHIGEFIRNLANILSRPPPLN